MDHQIYKEDKVVGSLFESSIASHPMLFREISQMLRSISVKNQIIKKRKENRTVKHRKGFTCVPKTSEF